MTGVCFSTGDWPSTIGQLVGAKAVTMLHGDQHTKVRRMMMPAFSPKACAEYIPRIVETAQSLCAEWAQTRNIKGFYKMKAFTFQVCLQLPVRCTPSHILSLVAVPGLPVLQYAINQEHPTNKSMHETDMTVHKRVPSPGLF